MRGLRLLVALLVTLSGASASAQVNEPRNFSAERFHLAVDKNGLLNVEWANVPKHLGFDLSLWMGIADDPLSVYRVEDNRRERVGALVSTRVGGEITAALSLFDRVQIGVSIPVILFQTRESMVSGIAGELATLTRGGLGSPRIAPKIKLFDQAEIGIHLALLPTLTIPTSQQTNYFGQDALIFEPTLLVSRTQGIIRTSGNIGARIRPTETFVDLEVDDEFFVSAAVGVGLDEAIGQPIEVDLALALAVATDDPLNLTNQSYFEALLGANYDLPGPLLAFVGGGIGLNEGHGAPDWRLLGGLRISDHERDTDRDGIEDSDDLCVHVPEDIDGFDDEDGCPDLDDDDDGIEDTVDGARLDPEDIDGFQDQDGIPDHDNDNDTVMDWDDQCPLQKGPAENRGCAAEDRDGDLVVDHLDLCPMQSEDRDNFEDDDGCPDFDNDEDGVPDHDDACMTVPGLVNNLGCPDTDRDGDGILDRFDNCPGTPGVRERQGCEQRQLVTIGEGKLDILEKVYFDTGRSRIQSRSFRLLDNVAAVIAAHPEIRMITVEGHTDDRGGTDTNQSLSERRAAAVLTYLVAAGIEPGRLGSAGYGEQKPVATNRTSDGRAANRRVEFVIDGDDGSKE